MKKASGGGKNLLQGLTRKNPKCYDSSMSIPQSTSVNDGARSGTAKTPATIGGRTA